MLCGIKARSGKTRRIPESRLLESFPLGYAAVYLGTAAAALDFTTEFCKTRIFKPDTVPISNDPIIQSHLGDLNIHLDAARAVLYQSASQLDQADVTTRDYWRLRLNICAVKLP